MSTKTKEAIFWFTAAAAVIIIVSISLALNSLLPGVGRFLGVLFFLSVLAIPTYSGIQLLKEKLLGEDEEPCIDISFSVD